MAIRAWKSDNKKVYADFCKRMDAVAKGNMSVLNCSASVYQEDNTQYRFE